MVRNMVKIDIPMPKQCDKCPCIHWGEWQAFEKSWCALDSKIHIIEKRRPKDYPLIKCEK